MTKIYQKITDVDVRRYKQCFALGDYFRPNCEYINRMTGLTITSMKKVAKMVKLRPSDLTYCIKNRIKFMER